MTATQAPSLPWLTEAMTLLERVATSQADAIERASGWCADAIAADGLVHLFGTGHSRIPVEEMFPRYGSYPGFNPIVELSMTFHTQVVGSNGQRQAMFIERPAGYLGEKVDADTGWVYPVPNETYAHGHDAMMADVVTAFREGRRPQETFEDGLIVNRILDAAYRSIRSGQWEPLEAAVVAAT